MTARRPQPDTLSRLRDANPAPTARLQDGLGSEEVGAALRAALALGEAGGGATPRGVLRPRRRLVFAGGLCAAALALAVMLIGAPGSSRQPAYAAAAIRVAESNPRLLVSAPGWSVTHAGEFQPDEGEVSFGDGQRRFYVNWRPASSYESYVRDRAHVSPPERSELLGLAATTVRYGPTEFATMLAPEGPVFVEVRGDLGSREAYDELLGSLRRVDVDTWLAAMPPDVVRPEARAAAVDHLLRGVPLPPGFDSSALAQADKVADEYQLAVEVANAVSCGWVEAWLAARRSGDAAAGAEAVSAMSAARDWRLMEKLRTGGGWSGNIESIARQLEAGQLDEGSAGASVNPDGSGYELGPAWAVAIECTSHYWRRPFSSGEAPR